MLSVQSPVSVPGPSRINTNSVISSCLSAHGIPAGRPLIDKRPRSKKRRVEPAFSPVSRMSGSPDVSPMINNNSPTSANVTRAPTRSRSASRSMRLARPRTVTAEYQPTAPTSIFTFASTFHTLLHSQAPVCDTHSAFSELLSVSTSSFPPSTLPIPHLTIPDLVPSDSLSSSSSVSTALAEPSVGLDLLSSLAEEADWDPQRNYSATIRTKQCQQQQHMQKAWADQIFGSLGLTEPEYSRKESYPLSTALPLAQVPKFGQSRPATQSEHLDTLKLTQRTAVFYERLYQPLCADIFPRAYVYPRLGRKVHTQDPAFAALALSMSILGLLQLHVDTPGTLTNARKGAKKAIAQVDRVSMQLARTFVTPTLSGSTLKPAQTTEAIAMITEALALRSLSEGTSSFGEQPTLESVMTSFFISTVLYALHSAPEAGDKWEQASFFRFSEAVTLAKLMKLDSLGLQALERDSFALNDHHASEEEQELHQRSIRVWILLVRAEQWWAQQRPGYLCQLQQRPLPKMIAAPAARKRSASPEAVSNSKRIKSDRRIGPLDVLVQLGFPDLFESLIHQYDRLTSCLEGRCDCSTCGQLTSARAVQMHDALAALQSASIDASSTEVVLLDLARQLLRCRLWHACDSHGLVSAEHEGPLRTDLLLHVALDILDLLDDLHSMILQDPKDISCPKLAVTVTDALTEIRDSVIQLSSSRYVSDPFLFDEEEVQSNSSRETPPKSPVTTTTIQQGSRAILVDLDHFLRQLHL